ncbi:GNAT family N-acetyltransferase [Streptomyces sp. SID13031]|uniref:GNAT family N-acetyltransferase n=1 Tax=Streptomyces sp. SID13031 TaxID=2706046 RepID=UPI0013CA5D4F|nr:GNAT family N-acetyltransferase [Streptomyces sp. SID13031]NEA33375.1 GNAT family N-acetyltransferase [Streptomyces sp. SID13031]
MELMEGVSLRHADRTDPAIVALATAQQAELAAIYGEDQPLVALHPDIEFILLTLDGTPVGCVGLQPINLGTGLGEIKRMYVEPSSRGWGLSRLLLAEVESHARSQAITTLRLETGTQQHEAIALYTHHGYQPTPKYPPFENEPASLCFTKQLD